VLAGRLPVRYGEDLEEHVADTGQDLDFATTTAFTRRRLAQAGTVSIRAFIDFRSAPAYFFTAS